MALVKVKYVTVEPVLFLYMFATLIQYVAVQDMVYRRVCLAEYPDTVCDNLGAEENADGRGYVQGATMYLILVSTIGMTIPTLISVGYIGSWSDKYGRKVPLIFPCIGNVLAGIIYIFIAHFTWLSIDLIILSSVLSGFFGGFVATIMAVMSYMASISDPEARTLRVCILESMTFLGGTLGLFMGPLILAAGGHFAVFLVFVGCNLLAIVYTLVFVSNVTDKDPVSDKAVNSTISSYFTPTHLWDSFKTCFVNRAGNKRRTLICLTSAGFMIFLTTAGEADVSYMFVKDPPLSWGPSEYSYYFGLKFFLNAVSLFAVLPFVQRFFAPSDTTIGIVSLISKISGLILLGVSTNSAMVYSVCFVSMLSSWCVSTVRSMLSKTVEAHEEGRMFAMIAALEVICVLIGALIFAGLYPLLRVFYRGCIFFIASALLLLSLAIFTYLHCTLEDSPPGPALQNFKAVDEQGVKKQDEESQNNASTKIAIIQNGK